MEDAIDFAKRASGIHDKIAADVPSIGRGRVWCYECGRTQKVNGAECLRSGWPECCGFTMSIDSPEERESLARTLQPNPNDSESVVQVTSEEPGE